METNISVKTKIRNAVDKIDVKQREYCEMLSEIIGDCNTTEMEFQKGTLWGYLKCIEYMGIITQSETAILYNYYTGNYKFRR